MAVKSPNVFPEMAIIQPFEYNDEDTGNKISVSVSPYYSKITINKRTYYFVKETGEFDGWSDRLYEYPILAYDAG